MEEFTLLVLYQIDHSSTDNLETVIKSTKKVPRKLQPLDVEALFMVVNLRTDKTL